MFPEGQYLPRWFVVAALLEQAHESPLDPRLSLDELVVRTGLDKREANEACIACINAGLIAGIVDNGVLLDAAISPIGALFLMNEREYRPGRTRKGVFSLPGESERAIFAAQMGYEAIREGRALNPYRNEINFRTLGVPTEELLSRLDLAIDAIRKSNSIQSEVRDAVLEKLGEGRSTLAKVGKITIGLLALLLINPLQEALNSVGEDVLKPPIEHALKFIREITGV